MILDEQAATIAFLSHDPSGNMRQERCSCSTPRCPGGLLEGTGSLAYGHTMAFTGLTLFQLFNVLNARSDVRSAFSGLFDNPWLWAAIGLSLLMQVAVPYLPWLQHAFSTVALTATDWIVCVAVASCVLWMREASKLITRASLREGDGMARVRPTFAT